MTKPTDNNPESRWQETVYEQLHRLAEAALRREAAGHSLQPTMLVHDAFLKLREQQNNR